jgi:hypothetical protein
MYLFLLFILILFFLFLYLLLFNLYVDNCNNNDIPDLVRYTTMRKALNATGTRRERAERASRESKQRERAERASRESEQRERAERASRESERKRERERGEREGEEGRGRGRGEERRFLTSIKTLLVHMGVSRSCCTTPLSLKILSASSLTISFLQLMNIFIFSFY